MADQPSEQLMTQTMEKIKEIADVPSVTMKTIARPPAKVIQEIFTAISKATGFPDPAIIQEKEIPKELKQERIDYIQSIIDATADYLKCQINCEAKNITAGKEVTATLLFLIKLCDAGRLNVASKQQPVESETIPMPQAQESLQDNIQPPSHVFPIEQEIDPQEDLKRQQDELKAKKEEQLEQQRLEQQRKADLQEQKRLEQLQEQQRLEQQKLQQEEDLQEAKRLEEAKRQQEQAEQQLQQKTQEAIQNLQGDKNLFKGLPPSQQKKTRGEAQEQIQYKVQYKADSSEESQQEQQENIVDQLDLNQEQKELFEAPAGQFLKQAQELQTEFKQGVPQSQQEKRVNAQQRISNQSNQKLIEMVQNAVKQVIPFSKATSFLEEHLIRMRQELMAALDDCGQQEIVRQKVMNMENKNRSVYDAKLRAVQEQILQAKGQLQEIAGIVM